MYGIIYKVTNNVNQKVYIGQTTTSIEERMYHHIYRAEKELNITHTHFINAIRKYGKDSFSWEEIDSADTREELNEKEIYWIQYYNSIENGYNIQAGGQNFDTDKFAAACGSKPFYAYRVNGEFLGEFINKKAFGRKYKVGDTHIANVLNHKYNSCNGYIFIYKEEFTEDVLKEKISKAKQSFRPIIAINLKTFEQFGPYNSMKECKEALGLKNNHIGEVLSGKRKSQEGYTFKFADCVEPVQ